MKTYNRPDRKDWADLCARPALPARDLDRLVEEVFEAVAKQGDTALKLYTERFDGISLIEVTVSPNEAKRRARLIPSDIKQAIDCAAVNIRRFHEAQRISADRIETAPGVICWREPRPIDKVGLYVPGGSAPLLSTVLMLGIPARIAGCGEIILCTPPSSDGQVDPAICYAALKVGVTRLVCVGGIQAIAALAYGTQSVSKAYKIFGPGNQYVTAAKQYAVDKGLASIDMPAGPSEVMVIADAKADPEFAAADLLSQAEHGPDSQALLLTDDPGQATAVDKALNRQLKNLPRAAIAYKALENSFAVVLDSIAEAVEFANVYAPEHLILSVDRPGKYAGKVINAGSVFLGGYSPESAGDYASGTNHTLPTGGWARSYGGVSLDSFVKKVTFQRLTKQGLKDLGPTITALAEAEGLTAHARAVDIRLGRGLS